MSTYTRKSSSKLSGPCLSDGALDRTAALGATSPVATLGEEALTPVAAESSRAFVVADYQPEDEFGGDGAARARWQKEVDDRRLKEWENYQRSHRSADGLLESRAFLDVSIGGIVAGRIIVELFEDTAPLTVRNVRAFLTGGASAAEAAPTTPSAAAATTAAEGGAGKPAAAAPGVASDAGHGAAADKPQPPRHRDYIGTMVHRISRSENTIFLGRLNGDSKTATGDPLPDECFALRHSERGLLSMSTSGPGTAGSVFVITTGPAPHLDFTQVIFGKVVDGFAVLDQLEHVQLNHIQQPMVPVKVAFCGVLTGPRPARSG